MGRNHAVLLVASSALLVVLEGHSAARAAPPRPGGKRGTCHALLVCGLPGSEVYARRFRDWLGRFHSHLTKRAHVSAGNVVVLSADKGSDIGSAEFVPVRGPASAESITRALEEIVAAVRPEDQFVLVLIGHGVVTTEPPTFVLPGPDLDAEGIAGLLEAVRARNQVVINLTTSAGASVSYLAKTGRVTVAANSPKEGNEPVFAEFFLRGIESGRADRRYPGTAGAPDAGKEDGVVTLLEAYNWATYQAAQWISRQSYDTAGKVWRIDGKESVEVFEKLCAGAAGAMGARKLSPKSRRDGPDEEVRIRPRAGLTQEWATRRVLSERAVLEDSGAEVGVSAITSWATAGPGGLGGGVGGDPAAAVEEDDKGFRPLAGVKKGEPGWLARRVVLGRAELLLEVRP